MHIYNDRGQPCHSALGWREDFHQELERLNSITSLLAQAPISVSQLLVWQNMGVDPRYR